MTPEDKEAVKKEIVTELKAADDAARRAAAEEMKRELAAEIEKEDLKKQVLKELRPEEPPDDGLLKHPATLLVLGFALTTIFGTIITSCWKYKEWQNEQEYLKTQSQCDRERLTKTEEIKQKYEVKEAVIKGVSETNTAAEEILRYLLLDPARRDKEGADRVVYWKEASRNWRINSKILTQRLVFRFRDPRVTGTFDEITRYRSWVGNTIDNQQEALSAGKGICAPRVYKANECMSHVTLSLMPSVVKVMTKEISADERSLREARCVTDAQSPSGAASPSPTAAPEQEANSGPPAPNACDEMLKVTCETPTPTPTPK